MCVLRQFKNLVSKGLGLTTFQFDDLSCEFIQMKLNRQVAQSIIFAENLFS